VTDDATPESYPVAARARFDRYAVTGVITITAIVVVATLIVTGAYRGWFAGGGRTVRAVFADAQQLHAGDQVRLDGVTVGKVDRIQLDPGARAAIVSMTIDNSAGALHADATAALRFKTVLGGAFYVNLARGSRTAEPLGSRPIPLARTSGQIQLEDVTSALQRGARTGLQTLSAQMAQALADPLVPASVLRHLDDVAPSVAVGVGALRGQRPDADLRTLVSATSRAMGALGESNGQLKSLVAGAAATVHTTADRAADIQSTIAQAPDAMSSITLTLGRLDSTLRLADPLIAQLQRPAAQVAPTVGPLRPTLVRADALLNEAAPLMRALRPAVSSLAVTSREGLPLLNGLSPSLARLAGNILPYLNQTDPQTKHTTAEMIGPALEGLGSGAGGQLDNNGHFIRFPATVGSASVYLPCQTYLGDPDKKLVIGCETLQQALRSLLSYNPLGSTSTSTPSPSRRGGSGR
jgi:phospholipid/cholesterol/gamma-HCH transport system substrate-binding protein